MKEDKAKLEAEAEAGDKESAKKLAALNKKANAQKALKAVRKNQKKKTGAEDGPGGEKSPKLSGEDDSDDEESGVWGPLEE